MHRTFKLILIAASAAALATTASAAEVTVSLVGKDQKTIRADVFKAAQEVCRQVFLHESAAPYEVGACVQDSSAKAMAEVRKTRIWIDADAGITQVASVSAEPAPGK